VQIETEGRQIGGSGLVRDGQQDIEQLRRDVGRSDASSRQQGELGEY
jgi:hypothetical protein